MDRPSREVKVDLLGRAKATLVPIRWSEPFGLVQVESMACGTPVIAHPRGAATEVIADGVTGFLCDTATDLVEAIARGDEISPDACRERVARHFSADSMASGYEGMIERVIHEWGKGATKENG